MKIALPPASWPRSYSRVHRFPSPCRCPDLRKPPLNDLIFKPGRTFITDNGRSFSGRRVDPVEKELELTTRAYISGKTSFLLLDIALHNTRRIAGCNHDMKCQPLRFYEWLGSSPLSRWAMSISSSFPMWWQPLQPLSPSSTSRTFTSSSLPRTRPAMDSSP